MFDLSAYRIGQAQAHSITMERLTNKQPYTSIVLPCGYGKSDVIRCVSLEAWYRQVISTCLVMSPTAGLRNQLVDREKLAAWSTRYQVASTGLKARVLRHVSVDFTRNGEFLVSTTTQLVQRYVDIFAQWVESQCYQHGRPPLIVIDEAQTESIDNTWGTTVTNLVNAGALAVLFTATPERSDGKPIPGFRCEEVDNEDEIMTLWRATDDPLIQEQLLYAAQKRTWTLRADHETTCAEAWAEGVIAAIDRFPYDMECEEMSNTMNLPLDKLSKIPGSRVQDYLGRVVREKSVMREGVKLFTQRLAIMRQTVPECAGMIFLSNDQDSARAVNKHAREIEKLIQDMQPSWHVLTATSVDGEQANADIERFANEQQHYGDVLLVKQMAACGVDVPRCKVLLDLSPVRAPVGWTQRIMRINRLYKTLPAAYICPDDVLSRTLFETVVRIPSDGRSQTYRDIGELLEVNRVPVKPSTDWRALYVGAMAPADFSDSNDRTATADEHPIVRLICRAYPILATLDTLTGISNTFRGWTPPASFQNEAPERTDILAEDERGTINTIMNQIVWHRLRTTPYDQKVFAEGAQRLWNEAKAAMGIPLKEAFGNIDDLALLTRIKKYVLTLQQQERRQQSTPF